MNKFPDWQDRLAAYVREVQTAGFRPGRHDCALFAAGAVKTMTGVDFAAQFTGSYRTLKEGMTMLKELGFESHIDMAALTLEEIPPLMARPGDIAAVQGEIDISLGVVQGPYIYVLTKAGLGPVPIITAQRAFRV